MADYAGKVKVINTDKLCFPADTVTLEPLRCGVYDPCPWHEPEAVEVIGTAEWNVRRAAMLKANGGSNG